MCRQQQTSLHPHPCLPAQPLGGAWVGVRIPPVTGNHGCSDTGGTQDRPWVLPGTSPPLRSPCGLRRDTKAILSVLTSSALHVFGEWGQLCGRLAEFQEVDVFLGFDSSLFALDEVATRESPFVSLPGWHRPQQGGAPWDTAQGLSQHRSAFPGPATAALLRARAGSLSHQARGQSWDAAWGRVGAQSRARNQREWILKALLSAGGMEVSHKGENTSGERCHAVCHNSGLPHSL